jgi:hypothetical protein
MKSDFPPQLRFCPLKPVKPASRTIPEGETKMKMTDGKKEYRPARIGSMFVSLFLMLCSVTGLRAQEQANEIVCSSGTACQSGFIALFSSNGGRAKVSNSLLSQGGSTVKLSGDENLTGNLAAGGSVSGSAGSFSGNVSLTGNLAMAPSTATAGNLLKGGLLFLHNFGGNNIFLGLAAGNLTMTGNNNTGTGANALHATTIGCCNTATGNNALWQNTSGGGNTASGDGALYSNTTGSSNTAIGRWALISNTIGNNNTATGVTALQNNCSSTSPTGSCLQGADILGSGNTAMGVGALLSNNNGDSNTAMGYLALNNNCASGCFFGEILAGSGNTAIGLSALFHNDLGSENTAAGNSALFNNAGGVNNTAMGVNALFSNTGGSNNTGIGFGADVSVGNLTNATAIGNGAIVNASNKIRLGNTSVTVIEGQVPYTFSSDKNRKENFEPVDSEAVLAKLAIVPISTWNYIGQDAKQFRHYGPMAQDFFAAFGRDAIGTIGTPTTLNTGDVAGILMIGVQALRNRTEKLLKENMTLRNEMETLSQDNRELRAALQRVEAENLASHREFQDLLRHVEAISIKLDRSSTLARSKSY